MVNVFSISNGGEALGPYEMGQLRSMWNMGQLTANTLYWSEDGNEWRGISELRLGETEAKSAARPEASLNLAGGAKATEAADDPPAAVKSDSLAPSQLVLIIGVIGFFVWIYVDSMWGKPWLMWVAAPLLLVGIAVIGHILWGPVHSFGCGAHGPKLLASQQVESGVTAGLGRGYFHLCSDA